MGEFVMKVNEADRLTRMFYLARLMAVELEEQLLLLGFYNVEFTKREVYATYLSARLRLGE